MTFYRSEKAMTGSHTRSARDELAVIFAEAQALNLTLIATARHVDRSVEAARAYLRNHPYLRSEAIIAAQVKYASDSAAAAIRAAAIITTAQARQGKRPAERNAAPATPHGFAIRRVPITVADGDRGGKRVVYVSVSAEPSWAVRV